MYRWKAKESDPVKTTCGPTTRFQSAINEYVGMGQVK